MKGKHGKLDPKDAKRKVVLYFGRNFFSPALDPLQDSKQEWNTAEVGVREKLEYLFGALGSSTVEYCR